MATWREALEHYYQTHDTLNDENRAWLRSNVAMNAPLIREMTVEQLDATFTRQGDFSHAYLMHTLVWQDLGLILCGVDEPINGNLRGYYYGRSKPVYSHFGLMKRLPESPEFRRYVAQLASASPSLDRRKLARLTVIKKSYLADLSERTLTKFVVQRIFRYQGPFQFTNANTGRALVGEGHASLVFCVEKEGLFDKLCKPFYDEFRISVMASKGYPSLVAVEYFADELKRKKIKNLGLAILPDYDPDGWGIAATYRKHFEQMGFGIKSFTILTKPDLYTAAVIAAKSYSLDDNAKADAWFDLTGGINGQRRGIAANNAGTPRVRKAVKEWYEANSDKGDAP